MISKRIAVSLLTADPCEFVEAIPHPASPHEAIRGNAESGGAMVIREQFSFNKVREVLGGLLEQDLHAKRVDSLCNATLGVLCNASLAVCTIGQGLAAARNLKPKHAIKQVDRLLSNPAINVDDILVRWVPYIIGARTSIVAALDWTDFDRHESY